MVRYPGSFPSLIRRAALQATMLNAPSLAALEGIRHGFFTREDGVSSGIYASLNCGPGSSDEPENVIENRIRVATDMGVPASGLITLYQVHSPVAVIVDEPWAQADAPQADAMVSVEPGIALGILTADCVPVLFADAEAGVIGAAHAGWKGAAGGVLEATVAAMEEMDADAANIHAVIGPCIHQQSYEVSSDFRDTILSLGDDNARFFVAGDRDGHFQFDLPGYVRTRLEQTGIGSVEDMVLDTYADEQRFFSFRRTTHRSEPDYGRQISVISLNGQETI